MPQLIDEALDLKETDMKIAINGAGIAGPTLAYWLQESGHEVLLIEESPRVRRRAARPARPHLHRGHGRPQGAHRQSRPLGYIQSANAGMAKSLEQAGKSKSLASLSVEMTCALNEETITPSRRPKT